MSNRIKQTQNPNQSRDYLKRIIEISDRRGGTLPTMQGKSGVTIANVAHERTCAIWRGKSCNCDFDLTFRSG